ncbi:hypothetical protein GQ53DRAFT_632999, partial [Thozetella sp. PMI_491]
WYPTRFLDLGTGGTEAESLKLCITAMNAPVGPYMTLSHCWGKRPLGLLSVSNIDVFKNEIPQSFLSATFIQGIEVTRRFVVRYLWIDSTWTGVVGRE